MHGAGEVDLTGVWLGLYSYPRALEPVSFMATLIDTAGAISGSSHEAYKPPRGQAYTAFAMLCGHRNRRAIDFVKTYEEGNPHNRPIKYEGTVRDDGSEIEGTWTIRLTWSGRFLMTRSTRDAESIVRKRFARA